MLNDANNRVLVAGATGAIGRRLCRLLVEDGRQVAGTTRFSEKVEVLRSIGVEAFVADVYDEQKLLNVVTEIQPAVVVHQLTDLPYGLDPEKMAEGRIRNARIRDVGTRNLIAASVANGVKRMVVQSIAFAYESGSKPYLEEAPLGVASVAEFEWQVLRAPFVGIVLRYGKLYGPGTGFDKPPGECPVHVDAAADAARRAVTRGKSGVYNIAENDGVVSSRKAVTELGWNDAFRFPDGR